MEKQLQLIQKFPKSTSASVSPMRPSVHGLIHIFVGSASGGWTIDVTAFGCAPENISLFGYCTHLYEYIHVRFVDIGPTVSQLVWASTCLVNKIQQRLTRKHVS